MTIATKVRSYGVGGQICLVVALGAIALDIWLIVAEIASRLP